MSKSIETRRVEGEDRERLRRSDNSASADDVVRFSYGGPCRRRVDGLLECQLAV